MEVTELLFTLVFAFVQHKYGVLLKFLFISISETTTILTLDHPTTKKVYFPKTSNA